MYISSQRTFTKGGLEGTIGLGFAKSLKFMNQMFNFFFNVVVHVFFLLVMPCCVDCWLICSTNAKHTKKNGCNTMLNFFGSKIKSKQVLDDIAYATQASSTLAKKIKLDERLAIILYNKAQVIPAVMIPNPDYESQQYMEMMAMEYIEKSPEQIKMLDKYKYAHVQNVEQGDLCKGILYHDDTALFPFLFKQGVNHVVATVTNSYVHIYL